MKLFGKLAKYGILLIIGAIVLYHLRYEITSYAVFQPITEQSYQLPQENGSISIYFCPSPDCEHIFVDLITNAQETVYCAFYDLDNNAVIQALANKSSTADVRLVIDSDNLQHQVYGEGIVADTKKQYMHNKFCMVDHSIVITGSANPTDNDFFKNNNNILVFTSAYLVNNYQHEFEELWLEQFGKGEKSKYPKIILNNITIENYFCPEDNCEEHIVEMLDKAQKSIYFMTFSFTSDAIEAKLLEKFNQSIDIKGVFEKRSQSKDSAFFSLNTTGIPVIFDNNPKTMHHKVFIIDQKIVVTGSYNPTKRGTEINDENVIIIHDQNIAKLYLNEFDNLYFSPRKL